MAKTSVIIDHLEGLSTEQKAEVGTKHQVEIRLRETDKITISEFYDTVTQANARKAEWDD